MIDLKLEVVRFNCEDVIATSFIAGPLSGKSGFFYIPSGQYTGASYSTDYVEFSGTFGSYNNGIYGIDSIYNVQATQNSDREAIMSNGDIYLPDVGITIPNTAGQNIAKNAYDAFSYGDGQYYTNGVNYYDQYWH